mgnify:FL=1
MIVVVLYYTVSHLYYVLKYILVLQSLLYILAFSFFPAIAMVCSSMCAVELPFLQDCECFESSRTMGICGKVVAIGKLDGS